MKKILLCVCYIWLHLHDKMCRFYFVFVCEFIQNVFLWWLRIAQAKPVTIIYAKYLIITLDVWYYVEMISKQRLVGFCPLEVRQDGSIFLDRTLKRRNDL